MRNKWIWTVNTKNFFFLIYSGINLGIQLYMYLLSCLFIFFYLWQFRSSTNLTLIPKILDPNLFMFLNLIFGLHEIIESCIIQTNSTPKLISQWKTLPWETASSITSSPTTASMSGQCSAFSFETNSSSSLSSKHTQQGAEQSEMFPGSDQLWDKKLRKLFFVMVHLRGSSSRYF